MMRFSWLAFLFLTLSCVPISQQAGGSATADANGVYVDKRMRTEDFVYENNVRTVLLYPRAAEGQDPVSAVLAPAVLPLDQPVPLMLEFDELGNAFKNYRAKIFHCNADWSLSQLNDMDFLMTFNDFLLNQPNLSLNTKVPYVHYTMEVPRVKLSGNYVVMVYREGNVKDILLTKRFVVFDNQVNVVARIAPSSGVNERNTNQQIEFSIVHPDVNLINPRENVRIVLRQNYLWETAITGLRPTAIWEDRRLLEYQHFGLENNFAGGNEFRFFDIRSIRFLGQNVRHMDITSDSNRIYLLPDKPRTREAYSQTIDFNGRYVIANYEQGSGAIEADYADVYFTLVAPQQPNGRVHVWGALTDWKVSDQTLMRYNATDGVYQGQLALKQGYYNFQYVLEEPGGRLNLRFFEGSHFQTENHYEVIAYYRPPGARGDLVIGYALLRHNSRN
jgi:hypothetical protein